MVEAILNKVARSLKLERDPKEDLKNVIAKYLDIPAESVYVLKSNITYNFSDFFYLVSPKDFKNTVLYKRLLEIYGKDPQAVVFVQGVKDRVHIIAYDGFFKGLNLDLYIRVVLNGLVIEVTELTIYANEKRK